MQYAYTQQLLQDMETASDIHSVLPRLNAILASEGFKKSYSADEINLQVTRCKYLRATMFQILIADGEVKILSHWQD